MLLIAVYFILLDIDECAEYTDSCSDVCVNTKGSYKCQCSVGYTLGSDGTTCNGEHVCVSL